MTKPRHTDRPPKVDNVEKYWNKPPPEFSDRCIWWIREFQNGWRPNRRIRIEGYYSSAQYYGVYIWEYINILSKIT